MPDETLTEYIYKSRGGKGCATRSPSLLPKTPRKLSLVCSECGERGGRFITIKGKDYCKWCKP